MPTVCSRSLDSFYIASYYIKWDITYWTYSNYNDKMSELIIMVFFRGLGIGPKPKRIWGMANIYIYVVCETRRRHFEC